MPESSTQTRVPAPEYRQRSTPVLRRPHVVAAKWRSANAGAPPSVAVSAWLGVCRAILLKRDARLAPREPSPQDDDEQGLERPVAHRLVAEEHGDGLVLAVHHDLAFEALRRRVDLQQVVVDELVVGVLPARGPAIELAIAPRRAARAAPRELDAAPHRVHLVVVVGDLIAVSHWNEPERARRPSPVDVIRARIDFPAIL